MELKGYGFISPDGKYYTCDYAQHIYLAQRICNENNYVQEIQKYTDGDVNLLDYEEYLYAKGYLGIASRYMAHSCYRGAIINNHDFGHVHLSECQKKFIKNNLNNAYNFDTLKSMEKLLQYDDYVDEINELRKKDNLNYMKR